MKNKELKKKILKMVDSNHIWINALACINPTDEFKMQIGNTILEMLKNKDNLLPALIGNDEDEIFEISRLTPVLYLSVNKS